MSLRYTDLQSNHGLLRIMLGSGLVLVGRAAGNRVKSNTVKDAKLTQTRAMTERVWCEICPQCEHAGEENQKKEAAGSEQRSSRKRTPNEAEAWKEGYDEVTPTSTEEEDDAHMVQAMERKR